MCTCITFINRDFYFGRNLDLEYSFGEQLVITPRRYPFFWSREGKTQEHYAMIGMGAAEPSYPLYAEAVNEKGLGMAGLNFPGNACYQPYRENMKNAASFELIPWILSRCATVREAEEQIRNLNVTDESFAEHMPPAPLHWMLADRERAIVLEAVKEGLKVYENPVGVLTNNPPFDFQLANLCNYMNLTARPPENRFAGELRLTAYGHGSYRPAGGCLPGFTVCEGGFYERKFGLRAGRGGQCHPILPYPGSGVHDPGGCGDGRGKI